MKTVFVAKKLHEGAQVEFRMTEYICDHWYDGSLNRLQPDCANT